MERASPIVAILVVGSALVFDPGGWHSFGPSKWVVITVTAWLAAAAVLRDGTQLHRPSLFAWAGLLIWGAATSPWALDPLSHWLGTPDRRLGIIALLTMLAAYLGGQGITSPAGRRLVGRAAVVALLGLTAYGLVEALGWAPVELTTTTDRLGSAYGSPAYLGAALCLLLPIGAGLVTDPEERAGWRAASALAVVGGVFLLAGSGTRAALIGLAAAAIVAFPAWRASRRRLVLVAAGAALLVLVSPLGQRLVDSPLQDRLAEWRVAASVLVDHPLTGVGLEGYRIAFPSHVDVGYIQAYGRSTLTDRAHSGPLDFGVALGIPGIVAWAGAAAWLVFRSWAVVDRGAPLLAGMAAGVVGLLAQQLFLFPTLEVGVAGWAISGIVVAAGRHDSGTLLRSRAGAILASIVAVAILVVGVADIVADHLAADARRTGEVASADLAASIRPDSFRYPLLAADLALRSGSPDIALDRIEQALDVTEADPALRLARARTIGALVANGAWTAEDGAEVVAQIVSTDPNQPELRLIHGELLARASLPGPAERAWLAAAHLTPHDITPELRLASLYLAVDRRDSAREALERAREIDPNHPEVASLEEELDGA